MTAACTRPIAMPEALLESLIPDLEATAKGPAGPGYSDLGVRPIRARRL